MKGRQSNGQKENEGCISTNPRDWSLCELNPHPPSALVMRVFSRYFTILNKFNTC